MATVNNKSYAEAWGNSDSGVLMSQAVTREKGFTIIELLMVIAIIGMLAAIAIPMFMGQREKAKYTSIKSSASSIASEALALLDDYSTMSPVVFQLESGGSFVCFEHARGTVVQRCEARYADSDEIRTYSTLGDLLDQMVVYHNDVLGEVSPFDSGTLSRRSTDTPGHVAIVNADDQTIQIIVNALDGSEIFYKEIRAR